jgi:hypothetical protein
MLSTFELVEKKSIGAGPISPRLTEVLTLELSSASLSYSLGILMVKMNTLMAKENPRIIIHRNDFCNSLMK